jgi:hypothetical protein
VQTEVQEFQARAERRTAPESGRQRRQDRYVPLHPAAGGLIHVYLERAGHGADEPGSLFRLVSNNNCGSGKAITPDVTYKLVRAYSSELEFTIGAHSLHRPPRRSMHSTIWPTSPKCWNGSAMRSSPSPELRSPQDPGEGQSDVQGELSISSIWLQRNSQLIWIEWLLKYQSRRVLLTLL